MRCVKAEGRVRGNFGGGVGRRVVPRRRGGAEVFRFRRGLGAIIGGVARMAAGAAAYGGSIAPPSSRGCRARGSILTTSGPDTVIASVAMKPKIPRDALGYFATLAMTGMQGPVLPLCSRPWMDIGRSRTVGCACDAESCFPLRCIDIRPSTSPAEAGAQLGQAGDEAHSCITAAFQLGPGVRRGSKLVHMPSRR
jgi:hypothetical protein